MAEVTMLPGPINGWDGKVSKYHACRYCGSRRLPEVIDGICTDCYEQEFGKTGLKRALAERDEADYRRGLYARQEGEDTMERPIDLTTSRPRVASTWTEPRPIEEAGEPDEPWKRQLATLAPALPEAAAAPVGEEPGEAGKTTPAEPWHKLYDQCLNCGKTDERQHIRGVCKTCYLEWNAASFNDRKDFVLAPPGMTKHTMADAVAGKAIALADDPGYRVTTPEQVTALITLGRESRMHGLAAFASAPKVTVAPADEPETTPSPTIAPPAELAAVAPQAPIETVRLALDDEPKPLPTLTEVPATTTERPATFTPTTPPGTIVVNNYALAPALDAIPLADLLAEVQRRVEAITAEAERARAEAASGQAARETLARIATLAGEVAS